MTDKLRELVRKFSVVKSLRMRLFIIIFVVGLVPCVILHYGILSNYEARAVEVRTEEVETHLRALANHLITYDYLNDQSSELIGAELAEFSALYDGRIMVISDHLKVMKDTYSMSDGKTIVSPDVVKCLLQGNTGSTSNYDRRDGFIEIVTPIIATNYTDSRSDNEESSLDVTGEEVVKGVLLSSVSTVSIRNTLGILSRKALLLEVILILAVLLISLVLSTVLMKPFEKLSMEISAVKAGYSTDPIKAPAFVETEHIADAFNQVLARMNALDESRQEFVSNVSHELKTPMTSMKVLADSLVQQENVPVEMYREFMIDIKNEVDRENQIITELLTLVRMDRKDSKLNVKECSVNKMVELILHRLRPIAQKRDIELTMVSMREVYAEIDEVKMIMVITNLVENAVKYNRDHGKVRVTINADPYNFYISVEDTGVGIPQDSLDKIYERFYRVDKSRSREVGGTGLGLSITKSIILQHHGAIDVQSILGEGTKFTVTIPLTYVAHPVELRRVSDRRRQRRRAASAASVHRADGTGSAASARRADGTSSAGAVHRTDGTGKKAAGSGSAAPKKKAAGSANAATGKRPAGSGASAATGKRPARSGASAGAGKKAPGGAASAAKKRPAGSSSANAAARKRPEGSVGANAAVRRKPAGNGSATAKKRPAGSSSGAVRKKPAESSGSAVNKKPAESGSTTV
ncbi:MAG: two-component sensor histidine kinase [Lachnospiraceae bacterium]|nr:two-component sensor histidine kinase [Lachnospiraceae bacterium]